MEIFILNFILAGLYIGLSGTCEVVPGSLDQTCVGRMLQSYVYNGYTTQSYVRCLLTQVPTDGRYNSWGEWSSCSNGCNLQTQRKRTCYNPTPCNGGRQCIDYIGHDTETKDCGPVDGMWSVWGTWSACVIPGNSYFGTGTRKRSRSCTVPQPQCGGVDCIGNVDETANCRNTPPCLTEQIFEEKYLSAKSPLIVYTSAQVDIYTLTANKCLNSTTLIYQWTMYFNNTVVGKIQHVRFTLKPNLYNIGLYKLHVNISYTFGTTYWADESMYISIQRPPPHASIKGGTGRTVGQGLLELDARSVSYSLELGPGNASGLNFNWKCMNFSTNSIYSLLKLNIDPVLVFNDFTDSGVKWYETLFFNTLQKKDIAVWITADSYTRTWIEDQIEANEQCTNAASFAVTYKNSTKTNKINSIPLTSLYNIQYLSDTITKSDNLLVNSNNDVRLQNGLKEFLPLLKNAPLISVREFADRLGASKQKLETILNLKNLEGLINFDFRLFEKFLEDLDSVLGITEKLFQQLRIVFTKNIINCFETNQTGSILSDLIGSGNVLLLYIDQWKYCLLYPLGKIMDYFLDLNKYDWDSLRKKDRLYTTWLEQELVKQCSCSAFYGRVEGYASLTVTDEDIRTNNSFLVYVRVEYFSSVDYFIQHVKPVTGNPLQLEIECRFNCMKKTAVSSLMSLKVNCSSCSAEESTQAFYSWTVKNFDLRSRNTSTNDKWLLDAWILTQLDTQKFVMRDNVLTENSGYLIEVNITTTNKAGTSIWLVTSNIRPRGGSCTLTTGIGDGKLITADGWKDEGFRYLTDETQDWKEQLTYKIIQLNGDEETLLYYGYESSSYINIKPGSSKNSYTVFIKIQIFDIFLDYTNFTIDVGVIKPPYKNGSDVISSNVASFMYNYSKDIQFYYNESNFKQVALNSEIAGFSLAELKLPPTIFDTDPENFPMLGKIRMNESVVLLSFNDLWDMLQNPDKGNITANQEIERNITFLTDILDNISSKVEGITTTKLVQIANSIGTVIQNKQFKAKTSTTKALQGSKKLLDKLVDMAEAYPKYEDYISTCVGLLRVLHSSLEALLPKQSKETPRLLDIYSIQEYLSDMGTFLNESEADLTLMEKAFIASRIALKNDLDAKIANEMVAKEVYGSSGLLTSMQQLATVVGKLTYRKQLPVNVQMGSIDTNQSIMTTQELVKYGLKQEYYKADFVNAQSKSGDDFDVQAVLFNRTPFSWDEESKYISSKTLTISINNNNTENPVIPSKVQLGNSFDVSMKTIHFAISLDTLEAIIQTLVYKLYWKNINDSLMIFVTNASTDLHHVVYLRRKDQPTEQEYDWKQTIFDINISIKGDFKVIVEGGLYSEPEIVFIAVTIRPGNRTLTTDQLSTDSQDSTTEPYIVNGNRTFTTDPMSTNTLESTTKQYIVNGTNTTTINRMKTFFKPAGTTRTIAYQYQMATWTTGCRVWDESIHVWNRTACQVSYESTATYTICICKNPPGNSFATTFYVPPNTIDFSTVFSKFDLKDNAAVFSTIISLIVMYILICVWAVRNDRLDVERWAVSYLVDNAPSDEYLYMLTVYTGLKMNASTKSNVFFKIISHDKRSTTDVRCLDDGSKKGFGVGSVRRFVMSVSKRIVDPVVLYIWHDNSGKGNDASWYLSKVVLEDIQNHERFSFCCNSWLSLDHNNLKSDCSIPVSDMSEMKQFSWRFQEEARHNATEAHLWLSVILRPEESNFTRAQRLACCLTLLFLTMISNAMFYGQDTEYNSYQITIGPIVLSITNLYISTISVLITAPPLFITAYLFRNSNQKHNTKQNSDEVKIEHNKKSLPNWCVLVSWTILTAGVLVSGFFVLLYSMEWGKTKSNTWLMNFFTSFFESVFIVDPIKIIGIAIVMSFVMKNSRNDDRTRFDKSKILKTKKTLDSSPVQYLIGTLRKKSIHTINREELDRLRIRRQQELTARQTLRDILIYLVFLFVLYTVSFSNRDSRWFYAKQHLEEELINVQETNTTMRFEEVKTIDNFYTWVNDTLILFMFPVKSITSTLLNANQRLYVNDQVNFKIGPLRLRQLRIKEEVSCTISRSCFGGYDIGKDDETNYCVSWNIEPCRLGEDVYNITSPAWRYTSSSQDVRMPVIGNLATYSGGGYMAEFAVNNLISKQYLYELYTNMWIDRKTRAVFTEFTLYNVHNNVFIYVSMLAEFMEVGGVLTSSSINMFRPIQHVGQNGVLILVCETIASIGCIILAIKTFISIWRSGRRYFKRFWNVVDLVIIILFFISVGMYIGRRIIIQYIMNIFAKNNNKFVNFSSIAQWDEMLNVMVSTLIFLTTLRIMRVLSYNERINQIGVVLAYVGTSLLGCFVLSFIVFSDFLICGHLIFGRHLYTYKDLATSSTTLLNAIIGKNSINDLFSVDPIIGRIYYFLFVFFVLWILMSIFNANLNFGITHVRQNFRQSSDKYGIFNVLMDILSYISEPFSQLKYKAKTGNVLLNSQSVFSNAVGVTHRQHNITDLMTSGEKETSTTVLKRRPNWNKYV